jgi:pimeloyl-ACP methyl ester carboxylesterase
VPAGSGPATIRWMRTELTPVAEGVELAADVWTPAGMSTPPTFVLVHGLASNARLWDGVAESLVARGHPVVTVDLRGHGRSSKPDGPYDVPTVADDLAVLIERLAIERPVVAGQSWGGNVALELAARHPTRVRGIACVDGGWLELTRQFADWDACRAGLAPPLFAGRRLEEIERYVRKAHAHWPESGIRGTLANFEVRSDGTVALWLTFDHHMEVLRGLWEHHPSAVYPRVSVPALLIPVQGGDADRDIQKRRAVEAASELIPNARVRWFTGDHDIHAQRPTELADAMHEMTADGFFG